MIFRIAVAPAAFRSPIVTCLFLAMTLHLPKVFEIHGADVVLQVVEYVAVGNSFLLT